MADPFDLTPNLVGEIQAEKAYGPIYSAQYRDAVKSARANELGHRLGLSPDIVESDMPNMMARDRLDRAVAQARQNQAYASMMANPRLAAAGIDDQHLPAVAQAAADHVHTVDFGAVSRSVGPIYGGQASLLAGAGVLASRLVSGLSDILSSTSGAAHAVTELGDYNQMPQITGNPLFDSARTALRLFGQTHSALSSAAEATRLTTSNRNFNDAASGVESIPTVATAAFGPEAPTALFATQGFSDAYDEGRKAGLNPNRSALYGVGDAAIMAGTSFLPEKYLGGVLTGKGGLAKTLGTGIGLNEAMTVLQGLNHWYFIDKPRGVTFDQFTQSLPDQMRSSLVSTITALGVTAGAGHVASRIAGHAADLQAANSLDSVMEAAGKSSTRTSNPSDFETALNQLVGDSDASDIYVPADKVLELFQPQEGKAQRDLRSDPFWGQYAPQIEEAGTLGGDVVVPLSSAATHLAGSPDWAAIRDHVRTRPGGASRAEIGQGYSPDELESLASDVARKIDETVPQLKAQGLTKDFAATLGYKGDQADAVSSLLGAGLTRAHALEMARQGGNGPSLEEFAKAWLPQAEKTTQAAFDAQRKGTEGVTAEAAQEIGDLREKMQMSRRAVLGGGVSLAAISASAKALPAGAGGFKFDGKTYPTTPKLLDSVTSALKGPIDATIPLNEVAERSANPAYRALARVLMHHLKGLRLLAVQGAYNETGHEMPHDIYGEGVLGVTRFGLDGKPEIWLLNQDAKVNGFNERTLLHESLHAALLQHFGKLSIRLAGNDPALLRENGRSLEATPRPGADEALKSLDQLWKEYSAKVDEDRKAGRIDDKIDPEGAILSASENADEMLAYASTHPDVQRYMRSARGDSSKSLWQSFVDAVRQLLGLDPTPENATLLSDTLDAASSLLRDASEHPNPRVPGKPSGDIQMREQDTFFDTQRRGNISIARDGEGLMTGSVIRAFEHADFSTAIHETGHFFLEDLKRRALGDGGTDAEKADWQAVKDWLGHGDDAIPEAAHEQWARGFERYIYEGKAPSQGLKALFSKMRDFMVSLYRSVRAFNSPISPEIRGVMDRLLASDDEINARQKELRLGDQALNDLMSAEEQHRYLALGEEARSEAHDKLYDKVLSTMRAERTREVAKRKSEIRQEIGDANDAQPIFRALKLLRSGVPQEDGTTERATIPKQWLVDNYGEGILDKMPKSVPPIFDEAHGVDPEALADQAGFENADQMVQKLLAHEDERQKLKAGGDTRSPKRALTETMTDERLRGELGDPFANLEEEADAALANDRQADRLSLELRALSRKTGKNPVPWKLAKDWARAHVRAETVRDASKSVQQYSRASSKAAQAVEEALAGQDYEAAFRAKQQQVLNLALMSEAKAAKDETLLAAKRLRRIAKADNIASVDQDYLDQAHRLLENVDMKARTSKAVDKRMAFEAWHAKQVEMEIDPVVPPDYQSQLGQTHWSRLSVDGLLDLDKAVKQIVKLGRLKQELKDGNKKRDFNEAVSEMQDRGGTVPPRKIRGGTTDPRKSPIGRAASWLRSIDAYMLKTEQMAIWLDHHDPNGPWQRFLYRPFAEAQGRQSDLTRQYGNELNALIKAMPHSAIRALTRPVDTPELIVRNKNHLSNGEAFKGTKDQVLMMAMNWGNLGNRQRLLDGFGWDEHSVASVFDRVLTKDDWDFVQGVWDTVDKLWPDVAQMERDVNGVEPEKIEAAEVPTPHGTYRGGYFPIVYDPMQTTHTAQAAEDKMAPSGGWWSISTRSSATKARAEQVKGRPLLLGLSVITHHMNEVIHDLTHRQAVSQAKKLLGNDRVAAMVNSRMGPEYLAAARQWVERIAKPNSAYSRASHAEIAVARYLNKAITTVGLGFRVGVSLKQLMGIPFSAKELGSDNLAKGMAIVTAHPVQAYKEMVERSAEMRARSDHLDATLDDMQQDFASGKLKAIGPRGIAKYAFKGIAYMDVISRTTVWTSAYNKGLAEGMSEPDAIAYGDRSVRQSHGIGFQKDRAALQSGHPFARALWPFFSYMNALYNAQRDVGHRIARAETAGDYGEAARRSWWVFAVPALLNALLFGDGPEDDSVEGWAKYLGVQTALGNLESLPFVGGMSKAFDSGYSYRAISYQQVYDSLSKAVQEDKKIATGEADVSGASIKHTMDAVGTLFAKPLGQIGATSGGLYDYATGAADPHGVGDWYNLLTRGSIPPQPTAAERMAGRKQ